MVEWWIHGTLTKLILRYEEKVVSIKTGPVAVVAIKGVANSEDSAWTYLW
jgi:hypothetical protein